MATSGKTSKSAAPSTPAAQPADSQSAAESDALTSRGAVRGDNFQSIDEFYQAVSNAVAQRQKMAGSLRALEHEGRLSTALFENKGRKAELAAKKPVNADTLQVGDAFTVRSDPAARHRARRQQ